ncbi:PD40 domain-containing protein [Candidatus Pacearchaeota archaeon]|nr:PD40 domain-containing protein [Candidatus Pacearchaeota archaeon]
MGLIKWILIIAAVLIIGVVIIGSLDKNNDNPPSNTNNTPTPSGVNWNEVRTNSVAKVSSDFNAPKYIPISSEGWEDSEYISQDGNTLYFIYLNLDLLELPKVVFVGPNRDPEKSCKNGVSCGYVSSKSQRGDTFYATKLGDNSWSTPKPHPLTLDEPVHGIVLVNDNKAYFHIGEEGPQETQIAYSEKVNGEWSEHKEVTTVNTKYREDDVYVNPSDDKMFFWSTRPDSFGKKNIYYSEKVNGEWQAPALMPEPINSNEDDMHPFLFKDKTLYFSSGRTDGRLRIYRSALLSGDIATGTWSTPEVIVESNFAVGEPTLPADGSRLYFLQIFNSGTGKYNADLMYAEKK